MTALPPLDEPCPDCTGPAGEEALRANTADWDAWNAEERAKYGAFCDAYTGFQQRADWMRSRTWRDLATRQPEELPQVGCVECDWLGRRPTDAGRQILVFLNIHQRKG